MCDRAFCLAQAVDRRPARPLKCSGTFRRHTAQCDDGHVSLRGEFMKRRHAKASSARMRAAREDRGEEHAIGLCAVGEDDFSRIMRRGQTQQAGQSGKLARAGHRCRPRPNPAPSAGTKAAKMAARTRHCGQLREPLSAGLVVEVVMAEHKGIAARQGGQRPFNPCIIASVAQQPQAGEGVCARHPPVIERCHGH